ncbi:hypothetical protein M422DRAFT_75513 [Sphaerobolus stellatus SS14]|uniref:Unplaced genomic scaffold SPHSTscaffold_47, whole genome shotgun sequence n=1 Tax=Sphaerobolus stellatus (strain SS14) TaxID=990650 RepID=A0A0C9VNH7_SPHS4|nr:hypothetical protein M422DRAFT_75513 [Sphaerobolus stellatus SS14]
MSLGQRGVSEKKSLEDEEKPEFPTKSLSSDTWDLEDVDIDPVVEKRLLRNIDWAILPLFMILYTINSIDRTAVGNAKIAGLESDLGLKGFDFNKALSLFYVVFIVVEIPSDLALKRFGSIWLAFLIIAFGIIAICTAFIENYAGLILTRIFLGLAEGGLLPGLVYVMSRYYRRRELVMRIGIFYGVSPSLARAFGGLLSSGLLAVCPIGTVVSWRKIFLVEGIMAIGIGTICLFALPADPEKTKMLTEEERVVALKRIAADSVTRTYKKEPTTAALVWRAFNVTSILTTLAFILTNISFQGLSLYLPTVIATLGHFTTVESQLRTVPPYIVAIVWSLTNSYISFRIKRRGVCILVSFLLNIVGYSIFVGSGNQHARYGACFLAISGGAPAGPMMLTWGTDNASPETVRAVTTALIIGVGQLVVWTYLPQDAPNYIRGNSLNLGAITLAWILLASLVKYIYWENAKRTHGERDYRLAGKTREEIEQLRARHPWYRYQS